MRKLAILLILIASTASAEQLIPTKTPIKWAVIHNGEVAIESETQIGDVTVSNHTLIYGEGENAFLEAAASNIAAFPELPSSGWIEDGKTYRYDGSLYTCRQGHNRTIYPPGETLALFLTYREGGIEWIEGEQVNVGTEREYNGTLYRCLQSHVTQENWIPSATPALWDEVIITSDCPDFVQPTGAHDVYNTGDCVTFNGLEYNSLIDNNSWSPTTYPAGWELVE